MADDATTLAHHLARLDSPGLAAFVADVWQARGYETEQRDGLVVATRNDRTVVVAPVATGRLGRYRVSIPSGTHSDAAHLPEGATRVDVVVTPTGGGRAMRLAADHDARLLTTADLRAMLTHAVSPADADRICTSHLGAPLSALTPPLPRRLRGAVAGLESPLSRVGSPISGSTLLVALLAVTLVVGAGAAQPFFGATDTSTPSGVSDSGTTGSGDTAGAVGASDTTARGSGADDGRGNAGASFPVQRSEESATVLGVPNESSVASIPGLGVDGVTNLTALADAQVTALDEDSFTIWIDRYEPRDGADDPTLTQRDIDLTVEGDRYLVVTELEANGSRERVSSVYYDGTEWVVADYENGTAVGERVGTGSPESPSVRDPRQFGRSLVLQYLDTPESNVTAVVQRDGRRLLRLEGRALPPGRDLTGIRNYRVVAYIDTDGLVYDATATFDVVTDDGTYRVRFEWTYDRFDTTTVDTPEWATSEENATRSESYASIASKQQS